MKAAIIGLGITGSALAIFLSKLGVEAEIFEQSDKLGPIGAGILLQPSGQMVLNELGLLPAAREHTEKITEVFVRTHRGFKLVSLRYNEWNSENFAYGIHRGNLFNVLFQELSNSKPKIHLSCRINRLSNVDKNILYDTNNNEYGPFDWVFCCNGSASDLMRSFNLVSNEFVYRCGVLWYVTKTTKVHGKLLQVTKGAQRLSGILPTGKGDCSFFWGATKDEVQEIIREPNRWKAEVVKLFPEADEIVEKINDPSELIFTSWRHRMLKSVMTEGVLFMGDAAYASSPHLGQGVNLGLLDAFIFYNLLKKHSDFKSAAVEYNKKRMGQRKFYAQLSYLLSPLFQSVYYGLGNLRDFGLPLISSVSPFRKQMISVLSGNRIGWFDFNNT